jgi:hypothetical protein
MNSSLADEYPEVLDIWAGRQAYSVYVQVGLTKNWTLQYCLPASTETTPAERKAHLEPPWPFDIVRPKLSPADVPANAIVVHGMVSKAGRFESLSVVYPGHFAYASFLLNILRRWQFRAATQDGVPVEVEIVLVIPEDAEGEQ